MPVGLKKRNQVRDCSLFVISLSDRLLMPSSSGLMVYCLPPCRDLIGLNPDRIMALVTFRYLCCRLALKKNGLIIYVLASLTVSQNDFVCRNPFNLKSKPTLPKLDFSESPDANRTEETKPGKGLFIVCDFTL